MPIPAILIPVAVGALGGAGFYEIERRLFGEAFSWKSLAIWATLGAIPGAVWAQATVKVTKATHRATQVKKAYEVGGDAAFLRAVNTAGTAGSLGLIMTAYEGREVFQRAVDSYRIAAAGYEKSEEPYEGVAAPYEEVSATYDEVKARHEELKVAYDEMEAELLKEARDYPEAEEDHKEKAAELLEASRVYHEANVEFSAISQRHSELKRRHEEASEPEPRRGAVIIDGSSDGGLQVLEGLLQQEE